MPDSPQGLSQSSLRIWEDPNAARMDFQLPPQNFGQRAIPISTPIIYGNGTMLSDIGEVTEAESNAGVGSRRASSRYSMQMDENETYGSVGELTAKAQQWRAKIAARERRGSNASISTITTLGPSGNQAFEEFDDSMSVGDSSFQGDDEESMASYYVEGTAPQGRRIEQRITSDPDDKYSTAYISDRAERILANAKRRLTAMEGNLTRARTSLAYSPASDIESTPSPTIGRPVSFRKDQPAPNAPHHSRIRSEDGTRDLTKPSPFPRRAASALGSSGGYRDPTNPSKRNETTPQSDGATPTISHHPRDTSLEILSEGEDILDDISETDPTMNEARGSGYLSPTLSTYSEKSLNRSASAAQMRDLHDQMQDLKGKISSLREQARVDSLKRRSLQSLRTPSPFTHARWDHGLMEPREIRALRSGEATPGRLGSTMATVPRLHSLRNTC
uniref:Uncharacterized protein n=1 Tax=Bionectria ochroleuca TaxID=29856 RepID=A0A8H7N9J0_BIOOC